MLSNVVRRNGGVLVCGTCMHVRAQSPQGLIGVQRSTLDEFTQEILAAEKVLVS